jgi:hypothetical protein
MINTPLKTTNLNYCSHHSQAYSSCFKILRCARSLLEHGDSLVFAFQGRYRMAIMGFTI